MIKDKIIIATPTYRDDSCLVQGCRDTVRALREVGLCVTPEWLRVSGCLIYSNRNILVKQALKYPDWTHLFFLDSDIELPNAAEDVQCMLAHGMDIVGAGYTLRYDDGPDMRCAARLDAGHVSMQSTGLHEVDWVGGGCMLIRRGVLDAMAPLCFQHITYPDGTDQTPEDVGFCLKAKEKGFSVYVDCDVQTVHHNLRNKSSTQGGSGMKVSMNLVQLQVVLDFLPPRGTLAEQITARDITKKVMLTEMESAAIGLIMEPIEGGFRKRFNAGAAMTQSREVEFSNSEVQFLKARLKILDEKDKAITERMIDVAMIIQDMKLD